MSCDDEPPIYLSLTIRDGTTTQYVCLDDVWYVPVKDERVVANLNFWKSYGSNESVLPTGGSGRRAPKFEDVNPLLQEQYNKMMEEQVAKSRPDWL